MAPAPVRFTINKTRKRRRPAGEPPPARPAAAFPAPAPLTYWHSDDDGDTDSDDAAAAPFVHARPTGLTLDTRVGGGLAWPRETLPPTPDSVRSLGSFQGTPTPRGGGFWASPRGRPSPRGHLPSALEHAATAVLELRPGRFRVRCPATDGERVAAWQFSDTPEARCVAVALQKAQGARRKALPRPAPPPPPAGHPAAPAQPPNPLTP